MKVFSCPRCAERVWFDNVTCGACELPLAYEVSSDAMVELVSGCVNRDTVESCNWTADAGAHCASCALDVDHTVDERRVPFEQARRRTLRQLVRFGIDPGTRQPELRFELLASSPQRPVTTGHADGLVTLDVAESEDSRREELREELGEPYRTPLGHVRHELGHWWWATAIGNEIDHDEFRSRFGDETEPYDEALRRHYGTPDDGTWREHHVSHYAASHPWEDFAESFAHVLHIADTTETARAHGVLPAAEPAEFAVWYQAWVDLSITLNELSRSMGHEDAYPFAPPPPAIEKLEFVASRFPVHV